jgi:hypothetical protein
MPKLCFLMTTDVLIGLEFLSGRKEAGLEAFDSKAYLSSTGYTGYCPLLSTA